MRPVSSATSMKSPGRHPPALGMVPAHERLGGGDVAGVELDDRLQLDDELAALGRAPEVLLQPLAAQHRGVHRGLEDLVALVARVLGGVHRDVGVAQQLLGVGDLGRPALDEPEARVRGDLVPGDRERPPEQLDDAIGHAADVLAVADTVQEDRELVAAHPRSQVLVLERAAQPPRDRREQLVADRVPEAVVDRLEVVEVEEQDGEVALPGGQQLAELLEEQGAVREPRERVVVGLMLEAPLQLAQLRDEVLEAVVLERHARVVGQRAAQREVVGVEAARLAAIGDQEGPDHPRLAGQRGEHRALDAAPLQRRVEHPILERALEQQRRRVAVDQRAQRVGHVAVGGRHRLDRAALLERGAQRLRALVGGHGMISARSPRKTSSVRCSRHARPPPMSGARASSRVTSCRNSRLSCLRRSPT
jgi:hypothetical protein